MNKKKANRALFKKKGVKISQNGLSCKTNMEFCNIHENAINKLKII